MKYGQLLVTLPACLQAFTEMHRFSVGREDASLCKLLVTLLACVKVLTQVYGTSVTVEVGS